MARLSPKARRTGKYSIRTRRRGRHDIVLLADLIETPHNFGEVNNLGSEFPLTLPGRGRLAVSSSASVVQGEVTATVGPFKSFGTTNLDADEIFKGVYGEKGQEVTLTNNGASGDISLYIVDDFGVALLIGGGTLAPPVEFLLQEDGDLLLQEDGDRIVL